MVSITPIHTHIFVYAENTIFFFLYYIKTSNCGTFEITETSGNNRTKKKSNQKKKHNKPNKTTAFSVTSMSFTVIQKMISFSRIFSIWKRLHHFRDFKMTARILCICITAPYKGKYFAKIASFWWIYERLEYK